MQISSAVLLERKRKKVVSVLCSRPFDHTRPGPTCPQARQARGLQLSIRTLDIKRHASLERNAFDRYTSINGRHHRNPITLISSVHTRLIHTLSLPSTPSTSSNSTPSHQHLLAGLRQKSRSFCAMPTALLFPRSLPRISLRSLASARLQTTALPGSPARWPHLSS